MYCLGSEKQKASSPVLVSKLLRVTFLHTENPQFWKYWYSAASPPWGHSLMASLNAPPPHPAKSFQRQSYSPYCLQAACTLLTVRVSLPRLAGGSVLNSSWLDLSALGLALFPKSPMPPPPTPAGPQDQQASPGMLFPGIREPVTS